MNINITMPALSMPSAAQVYAFSRHVVTFGMGAVTALSLFHLISPSDATDAGNAIQQISHGFEEIVGGVTTLVALFSGVWAAVSASPLRQMFATAANPQVEQIVLAPGVVPAKAHDKIVVK